jgi:hypothetical protein
MADAQDQQRLSFRQAAERILNTAKMPLKAEELVKRALADGLLVTTGKTPVATMAAQIYSEIQQHGATSTFVKSGKGLFALRSWDAVQGPTPKQTADPPDRVVPISTDPVERLASEVLTSQYDSSDSIRFERALAAAFAVLGFDTQHIGGPGRTDILLDASVSATSYRVVVDAKSNKNGKIEDRNIDWNSLDDHRKAENANSVMVVAPNFSGGNLVKRANDYGVALLTGASLAELLRLHRRTPFTLVDLRPLFEIHGKTEEVIEQLRQVSQATERRWSLIQELIEMIEQLPPGVFADAQKLWLLLSFQQKENAPSLDSVADALTVLSSRLFGVLKSVNGGQEFALTMTPKMAVLRFRALADLLMPVSLTVPPTLDSSAYQVPALLAESGSQYETQATASENDQTVGPGFTDLQSDIILQLQGTGHTDPRVISKRHIVLRFGNKTVGLAFRTSKCYSRRTWWWTFTKSADAAVLAECDVIVLVGLMEDPNSTTGVRDEVVFVGWEEAVVIAEQGKGAAWKEKGRVHIYAGKGGPWDAWIRPLSGLKLT